MAGNSKIAVYGAIGANVLIAVSKFVAASFTGSSAMISEGIHSLVDTSNGGLLLLGIKESKKAPDKDHPFGYGLSVYFWSFIVSLMVFALGGGFAIYEGVHHILEPEPLKDPTWNFVVLGLAMVFEGGALYFALREFNKSRKDPSFIQSISKSKDAATMAIIVEDTAALVGLVIAFVGVLVGYLTGNPLVDGIASVCIGVLLCGVAVFLARESKSLLLGESMRDEHIRTIEMILKSFKEIQSYDYPKTLHFGPSSVLLALDIHFVDGLSTDEIEQVVQKIETEIKAVYPMVDKIYIESRALSGGAAKPLMS